MAQDNFNIQAIESNEPDVKIIREEVKKTPAVPETPEATLKDLVEKNLKWSQIIYEQNRRLNRKLFWMAFASWFKIILVVASIVVATWFIQPYIEPLMSQYKNIMGLTSGSAEGSSLSTDSLIQMFDLSPEQQEKLKTIIK